MTRRGVLLAQGRSARCGLRRPPKLLQLLCDDFGETTGFDLVGSAVGAVQVEEVSYLLVVHGGAVIKEPSSQQVGLTQLLASCLHGEAGFFNT